MTIPLIIALCCEAIVIAFTVVAACVILGAM
jgi:hypothetical protein